jgi:hypothetical protein
VALEENVMATKFDELRAQLIQQDEEWAAVVERIHALPASLHVPVRALQELDDAFPEDAPRVPTTAMPIGIRA